MQVTCPSCQKTLQSQADLSGKTVKCKCGHTFAVPKAAPAVARTAAAAPARSAASGTGVATVANKTVNTAAAKITVSCSCGKNLQAPAAAAGKAVKCPCGQVVKVPAAPAQRAPATAARPMAAVAATAAAAPAQARRAVAQPAAPVNTSPNPFGDISDDEWKNMVQANAPNQVDTSKPKEKTAAAKMLEEARKETGTGNESAMEAALGFLNKTRAILVGLGILCGVRAIVSYWLITSMIDSMVGPDEEDVASFAKWIVMVFCGVDLGIGVLYIIFGFLVSVFPLTCAISALVIFSLVEIASLLLDPMSILSIRGWAFRIAIFGGLIQGVNNAAYYSHLKAEERAAKKSRH